MRHELIQWILFELFNELILRATVKINKNIIKFIKRNKNYLYLASLVVKDYVSLFEGVRFHRS